MSEDADEGDGGKDESLFEDVIVASVIVSARTRDTKRPCSLGCDFQASVG